MARRFTAEWWTGVLVLAVLVWHAAFPVACFAADQPLLATEPVLQSVQPLLRPFSDPR